ncbi:unnamed protein product [[Candida] boidinii]|nr:unnamed protein product [[Candida] boidinii]
MDATDELERAAELDAVSESETLKLLLFVKLKLTPGLSVILLLDCGDKVDSKSDEAVELANKMLLLCITLSELLVMLEIILSDGDKSNEDVLG